MEKIEPLRTGLKLRNSLTGKLVINWLRQEEFVPTKGNQIRWYTCGPTVYSHSHLGHARYHP
jgi:cysteinyl-tRNA synthetase